MDSSRVYFLVVLSFLCRVGYVKQQASPPTVMAPALARPDVCIVHPGCMCTCTLPYMGRGECELPSSSKYHTVKLNSITM